MGEVLGMARHKCIMTWFDFSICTQRVPRWRTNHRRRSPDTVEISTALARVWTVGLRGLAKDGPYDALHPSPSMSIGFGFLSRQIGCCPIGTVRKVPREFSRYEYKANQPDL